MEYYSRYSKCKTYYNIYNRHKIVILENEYLKYTVINEMTNYHTHTVTQYYMLDENRHHRTKPAHYIIEDDTPYLERWFLHDEPHRINAPARIEYLCGVVNYVCYSLYGKVYREDGPATIQYDT